MISAGLVRPRPVGFLPYTLDGFFLARLVARVRFLPTAQSL